jgi:ParB-like chromosome segregation protein Spo0J
MMGAKMEGQQYHEGPHMSQASAYGHITTPERSVQALPQAEWVPIERLHPAEWNPRVLTDERFENLCASIRDDPEFLGVRPILATKIGTIFAGNMRFRAAIALGYQSVPAILVDIPENLAKQRALRDNRSWGEWDAQMLAELAYGLIQDREQTSTLGFSARELSDLLGSVSDLGTEVEPMTPPRRCPTCQQVVQEGM